ncbi:MAG: murein biosynthesis integral membrane protein MurJ [Tissierellia bacterium]|nr:murein biosynthesis integral membrane protein MurJ [Tissierellia bacterium]
MTSTALTLMIITIISKITGLLREQFTSYFLGTGSLADIYSTASNIPFTIFGFIVAGVGTSFIPIYNKIKKERGIKSADSYTANLINILVVVSMLIVGFILVFAPWIVKIFAAGYSGEKLELTIQFTRILSFGTTVALVSSVFIGYLNLKGSFTIPAITGIIMNLLNILTFIIAYKLNNFFIIAFGFLLSDILKYFLFPRALKKEHYKHRFFLNFKDDNIKLMINMSIPIIISIAAVDLSTIADQSLATLVGKGEHGAVASLRYSVLILQLISGVIVTSISTALFPKLSSYAVENKLVKLKKSLMESIMLAQILVIPAMVGAMVLAKPIVSIIFERGVFDARSTAITSHVLIFYLPTLLGHSIRDLMVRANYSLRNIKTPVRITVIEQVINIVLSIIFSSFMGVAGLALGTSLATIMGGLMMTYKFRKTYGKINLRNFSISTLKVLLTSMIMGIFTYYSYKLLIVFGMSKALLGSVLISMLVYAIVIVFMGIPEVKKLLNQLYHKFIKK